MNRLRILTFVILFSLGGYSPAVADFKDDIGYTALFAELGEDLPKGWGVPVFQVESSCPSWMPDTGHREFSGKAIIDLSGDTGTSHHATAVGRYFWGCTTAMAFGITDIAVYEANHFIQSGFLRFNSYGLLPDKTSSRVANHSWVSALPPELSGEILRRLDWIVMRDEFIQVAGLNNGSSQKELFSNAFNAITVGRTDAHHPRGSAFVDETYTAGRTRPDLVAPMPSTSAATPVVSSAVSLLVELGHRRHGLSTDPAEQSTANRTGATVYNAERSEVIKAVLMAGADRRTENTGPGNITNYRKAAGNKTANGLDARYGAGQVNIKNAHRILSSGEQNSKEDDPARQGIVSDAGFDYDPSFGGAGGSNSVASYSVSVPAGRPSLCVSLVWNLKIAGGDYMWSFDGTAALYDLDIHLYDVTEGGVEIGSSTSRMDNTENLFVPLTAGHDYLLQVTGGRDQGPFEWDYALAWQVRDGERTSDTDGDSIPDDGDNCFRTPNILQIDTDSDGYGNACDCDLNNDGKVDMSDYSIFKKLWLSTGRSDADFNGDETVNIQDYFVFKSRWLSLSPYY